jgi:transcriptional regulator GlxA family with amidase domain
MRTPSIYADAVEILARDYARTLTAGEVAHRVATSPRQLQRAFAEQAGTSFRSHLTRVRMSRAAALLTASHLSVAEVAHRVGYREPSQFTKAFKRIHGTTPTEMRKRRQHPEA